MVEDVQDHSVCENNPSDGSALRCPIHTAANWKHTATQCHTRYVMPLMPEIHDLGCKPL